MRVEENKTLWDGAYDWAGAGEEWSQGWGGSDAQWQMSIRPRIQSFLPADTILEIAPGFGRWTRFLAGQCRRLILVDLSERCIEYCRQRFSGASHISYHVNDGRSLAMLEDGSVDFVFSFDSLVHSEADVLEEYLKELAPKMKPDGAGFLHHSNIGEYAEELAAGVFVNQHARGPSMTAAKFVQYCEKNGFAALHQEVLNWGLPQLSDCFSTFARAGSRWARPFALYRNPDFMQEAELIRRLASLYPQRTVQAPPGASAKPQFESELDGLRWRIAELEGDRTAREKLLEAERTSMLQLRAELTDTQRRLQESESDRAARLEVIHQQGARIGRAEGEANDLRAQLGDLQKVVEVVEKDRADRLFVIGEQAKQLELLNGALTAAKSTRARPDVDPRVNPPRLQPLLRGSGNPLAAELPQLVAKLTVLSRSLHAAGTFSEEALRALARHATAHPIRHSVETGAGISTLLLSQLSGDHLVFAVDGENGSVNNTFAHPLMRRERVRFVDGCTQITLPEHRFNHPIDFALIDGPHAWPFPDLEYFYLYPHIPCGGTLVVDDIQIRSIRNMFEVLKVDRMWRLEEVVGQTAFFIRTDAPTFHPSEGEFMHQDFNCG